MQQGTRKGDVIAYPNWLQRPAHAGEGKRGHAKRKGGYRPWRT